MQIHRILVASGFALVSAMYVLGLFFVSARLDDQAERVEPWKAVAMWSGDAVAFLFFLTISLQCGLRDVPPSSEDVALSSHPRWWLAGAALTSCLAVDVLIGFFVLYGEYRGNEHAIPATAQVRQINRWETSDGTIHRLSCRFADQNGDIVSATVHVRERPGGFQPDILPVVADHLKREAVPFKLNVVYDPVWPRRCWITGSSWHSTSGHFCHGVFQVLSLWQFITCLAMLLILRNCVEKEGTWPWWAVYYPAGPFVFGAALLFLVGGGAWLDS